MGRIISREILFYLVHIGLNHCNISEGIKVAKLSFAVGKDHVIKLWIRDDVGYDIDTPDDFERLKQRESEAL